MHKVMLCSVTVAILAGCATSPPAAPLPDESTRRQVNSGLGIELQNCQAKLSNTRLMLEQSAGEAERTGNSLMAPAAHGAPVDAQRANTVYVVLFKRGEHEIRLADDNLARLVSDARSAAGIQVRGRTDAAQDNALDRDLAARRASAVFSLLVDHGVDPLKIRLTYQGQGDPISSNHEAQARALNRRAEIEIYRVSAETVIFASRSGK